MRSITSKSNVQGEGDYASAKKYNEHARAFAQSGKLEQAATEAAPRRAKVEQDKGPPGRPKPDKRAPGKHPHGRNPIPEKLPGR